MTESCQIRKQQINFQSTLQPLQCKLLPPLYWQRYPRVRQSSLIQNLICSRQLFDVQKIQYELTTVNSIDIDATGSFLLVGLCNGSVDIQEISDLNRGDLKNLSYMKIANVNLHRVQWYPGQEHFFSALDNSNLYLIDPNKLQVIDKFPFTMNASYSEWNLNNDKIIAVCGSESQVRLVDIKSGNSAQTIILSAPSRLPTHRATRCIWSKSDTTCLIVGDNEGYLHIYDTRHSRKPLLTSDDEFLSQISGLSFTTDQKYIITSHGSNNKLTEWSLKSCKLIPNKDKFRKVSKPTPDVVNEPAHSSRCDTRPQTKSSKYYDEVKKKQKEKKSINKQTRKAANIPGTAFMRCQFYVSDNLLFCPVPLSVKKSKELYIYDLSSGLKLKTLKSEEILSSGVYSVVGLIPDSLTLYVGGRGRLKVWSPSEDFKQRLEEKMKQFHRDDWDSD